MKELREELLELGYNRDLEIEKRKWMNAKDSEEHEDSRSLAALEHRDEPTYRDTRERRSLELKDYRNRKYDADFVAELEHYNPDKRPLSHLIVDFPLWLWKNRIKNRGPKQR
ncbi:MAG: hypothetical protein ABEK16_05815 [Candidatus Nanohalobium sp.]